MRLIKSRLLIASVLFISLTSFIQDKPRILIIGDSISIGYTPFVKESLTMKADVFHNPGNARHTGNGLKKIEKWVGDEKWDIIQFNWGLWDLCYRHPDSNYQGNRDKVNGKITYSIDEYASNLDSIVTILRSITKAKLIFVTSSYVPENEAGRFEDDAIRYNDAAKKIMKKHSVVVNDIYEQSVSIHQEFGKGPDDVHYTKQGYKELGELVVDFLNTELQENVSPKDLSIFKAVGFVRYSDFGALGDGKTDDTDAIAATHAFANKHDIRVKADEGATYYIGGKELTAVIQTDTDFGTAAFIIDDTEVQNRNASIFMVSSSLQPFKPDGITSLKRNQEKIDVSLPGTCLVTVTNSQVRRYIRYGPNQNDGSPQTDIIIVDKNGNVDMDAPIIWDFDTITEITALPIDEEPLNITGGRFTTIANNAESKYTYYSRNIAIRRSNVLVNGLEHRVTGEGDHGAPYGGFINIRDCSNVTVKNTLLTGHLTYRTIGSAGRPVSMGSYDISVTRALNVSFVNCSQTNDINDRKYWGIIGSNYCKNLVYDNCTFSRFDAHMGVANASIRNSSLGHMGINAIGTGTFTVENTTIRGRSLINLRSDYGSTWQGEFIIRNCIFVPSGGRPASASLISGSNSGQHDFGYTCYMPERITIENLHIDDSNHPENYQGPAIFAKFNPDMTDDSYQEKFPYVISREVILRNVTTASGKALRISDNPFMFKDVKINAE
jgi:hypothetical protein